MKTVEEIKRILESRKEELKGKYNVKEIGIFGSYVKGDQSGESDLDILVDFEEAPGLLQFIEIENYLSDLLDVKVDLVMKDSLKPVIGRYILDETITI